MSDFKVEFTLKQHTPIIHFQSDQKGATLRATELKPKLDKFLLEQVDNLPFVKNANGHLSLNYKVTVDQDISKREDLDAKKFPLFFGNMKPKKLSDQEWLKLKKRYKFNNKAFKITFFSFEPSIKKAIEMYFEIFLAQTNFGTRQSKGFGSFYLFDDETRQDIVFKSQHIPFKTYSFRSTVGSYQEDIKLLYSFLRQGINLPKGTELCPETNFYAKPAIFAFAKKQGWTWDKKAIKEKFFTHTLDEQIGCRGNVDILNYDGDEKYLLRDLFGLSSEQSWMSYGKTISKEGIRKETINRREVVAIQRFKSPITFKPIIEDGKTAMRIYFWADDSVEDILGEAFKIRVNGNREDLSLHTPSEFSFSDFFEFAFNIDLSQHISGEFHTSNEYKKLSRIFEDIKASR